MDVCRVLLEHNTDIEIINNDGENVLYWALRTNNDYFVRVLIEHGAILSNVELDEEDTYDDVDEPLLVAIPEWVPALVAQREHYRECCRQSALAFLGSLRKGRVATFRGNGKDVAVMITKIIWASRYSDVWAMD
jgi:hypothetical protein